MNYEDFLSETEVPTVVDFWAEWCGPCSMFSPVFEDAKTRHKNVNFIKINIDENIELCKSLGIMSIPTIHFYMDGICMDERSGALSPSQLDNFIEENLP
jgi:thioredoxin